MTSIIKLAILITASQRGFDAFNKAEGGVKRLWAAIKSLRGHMVALMATEVVAFVSRAIDAFSDFSLQISRVAAITGDVETAMGAVTDRARELGASTIFTASESAEAMFFLAQAGLNTTQVINAVDDSLRLAQIGLVDAGRSADILTDIMKALGLEVEDLEHITDVLAFTASRTNTTVDMLGSAFAIASPIASAMGVELEELAALFGVLADRGMKGTIAGTSVRRMLTTLLNPSNEAKAALQALGITLRDTEGRFIGMIPFIQQLVDAQSRMGDISTLLGQIFTDRAIGGVLNLMQGFEDGKTGLVGLNETLRDSEGEAAGFAKRAQDIMGEFTFAKFKELKSVMMDMLLSLGDAAAPIIDLIIDFIKSNKDGLVAWAKLLGAVIAIILAFPVGVFVLLVNVLGRVGLILEPLVPLLHAIAGLVFFIAGGWVQWLTRLEPIARFLSFIIRAARWLVKGYVFQVGETGHGKYGFGTNPGNFPEFQRGGVVPRTGLIFAHKGETVVPSTRRGDVAASSEGKTVNITQSIHLSVPVLSDAAAEIEGMLYSSLQRARYL